MTLTATYDPLDNKLRLRASSRLDRELYERIKESGFRWAPKQELFVAPMWTPARADLLMELCGEIGDEDTSLVERAEERAERFQDYSEARSEDAERAHKAVDAIAGGIPLGQPILVGHHSEKHARKDAERIENGMRKAVKMWETSLYWKARAEGAIRAAKYKERPDVRARRIKYLEADKRKHERDVSDSEQYLKWWSEDVISMERAKVLSSSGHVSRCFSLAEYPRELPATQYEGSMSIWSALYDGVINAEQAKAIVIPHYNRVINHAVRWLVHINLRLAYEYLMLAEAGGLAVDKFDIQVGGRVSTGGDWYVVSGLNRKAGQLVSVSVIGRYASVVPVEEIRKYLDPEPGDAERVKAINKKPPLVNFRAPGCVEMTMEQWKVKSRSSDMYFVADFNAQGSMAKRGQIGEGAVAYRQRSVPGRGQVWTRVPVFITDAKVIEPPRAAEASTPVEFSRPLPADDRPVYERPAATKFDAMKDTLAAGVKVAVAPQLFPTPKELARRMVELARIQSGETVLEPSAGTGVIVRAIIEAVDTEIVGYEINQTLVSQLASTFPGYRLQTRCRDFLEVTEGMGCFGAVVMNPPFANAEDIAHICHAMKFLKPGGVLVAICANGPRQRSILWPLVDTWEELPAGTFESSGTGVNAALLTYTAPIVSEGQS